jgi:uncharacterized protein (TIGR02147 family)
MNQGRRRVRGTNAPRSLPPLPPIYRYIDYRHYLTDTREAINATDPSFSLRAFARMAGSSSPNFLQLIRDRKLNLGDAQLAALAEAFGLTTREERYFETIVAFDHARTHDIKDKFFRRILHARDYGNVNRLEKKQYDFFSHWYIPVVRELLVHPHYPGTPEWIAERVVPAISAGKVRKAVRTLTALGMIRKDRQTGGWSLTEKVISTPSEVLSIAVINYHREVIRLGREALERFGPSERDIRSVTLGLSSGRYRQAKKILETAWKELLALGDGDGPAEQVYQVNSQLFPLSKREETDT